MVGRGFGVGEDKVAVGACVVWVWDSSSMLVEGSMVVVDVFIVLVL